MKYPNLDEGERISPEAEFLTSEAEFKKFVDRLLSEEGIDLSQYKQNQMRRRINMTVRTAGQSTYCGFLDYAKKNEEIYRKFIDRITINVSEFMRNQDKFKILEEKYLAPMIQQKRSVTIWSAGCSTGEEPYSLALLLEKHKAASTSKIIGWDFDKKALATAAEGIYAEKALANVPKPMIDKYFQKVPDGKFQVTSQLKKWIRLERHNLLEDRFPLAIDCILCRNVVIYFRDKAKEDLFKRFGKALAADGLLMIGASERIPNAQDAGLKAVEPFSMYRWYQVAEANVTDVVKVTSASNLADFRKTSPYGWTRLEPDIIMPLISHT